MQIYMRNDYRKEATCLFFSPFNKDCKIILKSNLAFRNHRYFPSPKLASAMKFDSQTFGLSYHTKIASLKTFFHHAASARFAFFLYFEFWVL